MGVLSVICLSIDFLLLLFQCIKSREIFSEVANCLFFICVCIPATGLPPSSSEDLAILFHEGQDNLTCTCYLPLYLKINPFSIVYIFLLIGEGRGEPIPPLPFPSPELGETASITFPRWQTPSWTCLMTQIYLAWTL